MNNNENPYFQLNKYLLSLIGQWPYQTKLKKYFFQTIVYLTLSSFLVPQYLGFRKVRGDVDAMIECIPPVIIVLGCLLLTTNFTYHVKKMELLFAKISHDWNTWTTGPEVEILKNYANTGKVFTSAYTSFLFVIAFLYMALPILPQVLDLIMPLNETRPRNIIYVVDYNVNTEEYFYWILTHCYLTNLVSLLVYLSADTMFVVIMQHACGIFAIIGFVNDIQACMSTVFFLVLVLNILLMSITGFQTVIKISEPKEAFRFGASTVAQILHLLFLTLPCQQLTDHSINISSCIYNGYWYRLSAKTQKMLLIIMRKSAEPCYFIAGKLYIFSMQSFAAVLQTSMSYFTLLMSVR